MCQQFLKCWLHPFLFYVLCFGEGEGGGGGGGVDPGYVSELHE